MSRMLRIVVGAADPAHPAHGDLALWIVDRARQLGFVFRGMTLSRTASSPSRYIHLEDKAGQPWRIRVSDHRRHRDSKLPTPHLDLVSLDGASGFDDAARFLAHAASGELHWFRPTPIVSSRRPKARRRNR